MPTSVTALEKEMSRRARWGQESEISLSRESVVTFKIDWHYSDWVVIVPYKKYRGLCPIMEGTKQYEIGNKNLYSYSYLPYEVWAGADVRNELQGLESATAPACRVLDGQSPPSDQDKTRLGWVIGTLTYDIWYFSWTERLWNTSNIQHPTSSCHHFDDDKN